MTSSGEISLKDIRKMLRKCAPEHDWVEKDHRIHVTFKGAAFRNLPTADKKSKGKVQRPWVKKLAQALGILECAKLHIPALRN